MFLVEVVRNRFGEGAGKNRQLNHESRDRDPGSQEKEEKKKLPYFSYTITDRFLMYLTLAL